MRHDYKYVNSNTDKRVQHDNNNLVQPLDGEGSRIGDIFHLDRSGKSRSTFAIQPRSLLFERACSAMLFSIFHSSLSHAKRIGQKWRVLGSLQIGFPSDNLLSLPTLQTQSFLGLTCMASCSRKRKTGTADGASPSAFPRPFRFSARSIPSSCGGFGGFLNRRPRRPFSRAKSESV
jgi:hypothetical protein